MCKTILKKYFLFAVVILVLVSCDNGFNELGSDIVGNNNFEYGTPETYEVTAINDRNLGAVDATSLPVNALGIYDNPVFGVMKAHFVTQIQLGTENPTIAANPVMDSVVLSIPYFNKKTSTDSNGTGIYDIDSIYGPALSKFKLHIYESGYYIRDLDPSSTTQESQKYYTNQNSDFYNKKGTILLNDAPAAFDKETNTTIKSQNDQFFFSAREHYEVIKKKTDPQKDSLTYRTPPGIRFMLNKDFFQNKIFGTTATGKLLNNNVFKEYFRGLYFNVDQYDSDAGNLGMINFNSGKITLYYKEDKSVPKKDSSGHVVRDNDGNIIYVTVRDSKTLLLNLNGKSVSLHENTPSTLPLVNDRLYVKGGEGSMAVIKLFGGGNSAELQALKANKWVVNDASLTFYIDDSPLAMGSMIAGTKAIEPNRIYLYDLKNKRPIVDYYSDQTTNGGKANYGKTTFGGIIKKKDGRGTEYKIRLTNHIRNLLSKDSTNVDLGLVVTQNVALTHTNKKLKTTSTYGLDYLPSTSVMNPFGTVLYGSSLLPSDINYNKRVQLKIYYTKPKQN